MHIGEVIEREGVAEYLARHQLAERYTKATNYLLRGAFSSVDLKKRKPKQEKIWQFRITKKYRAFGYFKGTTLVVFEVNDHQ